MAHSSSCYPEDTSDTAAVCLACTRRLLVVLFAATILFGIVCLVVAPVFGWIGFVWAIGIGPFLGDRSGKSLNEGFSSAAESWTTGIVFILLGVAGLVITRILKCLASSESSSCTQTCTFLFLAVAGILVAINAHLMF